MEFKILTHSLTQKVHLKHFAANSKCNFILAASSELQITSGMQRPHTAEKQFSAVILKAPLNKTLYSVNSS